MYYKIERYDNPSHEINTNNQNKNKINANTIQTTTLTNPSNQIAAPNHPLIIRNIQVTNHSIHKVVDGQDKCIGVSTEQRKNDALV